MRSHGIVQKRNLDDLGVVRIANDWRGCGGWLGVDDDALRLRDAPAKDESARQHSEADLPKLRLVAAPICVHHYSPHSQLL